MNSQINTDRIPDSPVAAVALPSSAPLSVRERIADFYELTKPRLNFLVIVTTAVGYYMAVRSQFEWLMLLNALVGTALTAAGSGVLNQYLERQHDARMPRTANRPLPRRRVARADALAFGIGLSTLGLVHLAMTVNAITAFLGAFTLATYLFVYTPLKRQTTFNTLVGAVPGAVPFLMGWTAVRGQITLEGLALFAILFFWQMPHFLAIAILYRDDYARAGFRMLPVLDPDLTLTGRQIVLHTVSLLIATMLPVALGMAGAFYFATALICGAALLWFAISCAASRGRRYEARRLFLASVLYLPILLTMLMIGKL